MFPSIKNLTPIYLYLISVVCFVLANIVRDQFNILYYILLLLGIVFFVMGFRKRINNK
jgi:hypothetical protein